MVEPVFSATETVLQVFRWKLIDAEDSMNNHMASVTITYRSRRVVQLENRLVSASSGLLSLTFVSSSGAPRSFQKKKEECREAEWGWGGSGAKGKSGILRAQSGAGGRGRGRGGDFGGDYEVVDLIEEGLKMETVGEGIGVEEEDLEAVET